MKKKIICCLLTGMILALTGCGNREDRMTYTEADTDRTERSEKTEGADAVAEGTASVTEGTEEYRGFILDNVLHSENDGEIHYNLYVPES